MQAMRSAGVLPVLRATGAGVASALLALLVFLLGLFELIDPVAPDLAQVGAGSLIVFAAAALGGAAGATVERGYEDSVYEYTNDLSVRDRSSGGRLA